MHECEEISLTLARLCATFVKTIRTSCFQCLWKGHTDVKRRTLFSIPAVLISSMLVLVIAGTFLVNTQAAHAALAGDLAAHDPSLIREGNTYYVFSTGGGLQIRTSPNGVNWTRTGTVFSTIPAWVSQTVGSTVTDLWAPDIHD